MKLKWASNRESDHKPSSDWVLVSVNFVFYAYIFSDVISGVIRHFASLIGFVSIVYVPKFLLLIVFAGLFVRQPKINIRMLFVFSVIFVSVLRGEADLPSPFQSLFGFWVLLPFIYGVWAGRYILIDGNSKTSFFVFIFFIASGGVLLNTQISFPWSGENLNVYGASIQAAVSATDYGITRYGGFSSASYNAAGQILLSATWVVIFSRSRLFSIIVWLICGITCAITTTKGIVGSFLILSLFFAVGKFNDRSRPLRILWCTILFTIVCLDVGLPLYSLTNTAFVQYHTFLQLFLLESFGDRLSYTWPASLHLLVTQLDWIIGRGMGGIGDAQSIYEPDIVLPGDNIFIYLTVQFGVVVVLLGMGLFLIKVCRAFINNDQPFLLFPFALLFLSYGMVVPVLDWPTLSLIFGASVGVKITKKQTNDALYSVPIHPVITGRSPISSA